MLQHMSRVRIRNFYNKKWEEKVQIVFWNNKFNVIYMFEFSFFDSTFCTGVVSFFTNLSDKSGVELKVSTVEIF